MPSSPPLNFANPHAILVRGDSKRHQKASPKRHQNVTKTRYLSPFNITRLFALLAYLWHLLWQKPHRFCAICFGTTDFVAAVEGRRVDKRERDVQILSTKTQIRQSIARGEGEALAVCHGEITTGGAEAVCIECWERIGGVHHVPRLSYDTTF